ncbi:MAG: peptide deformylase [Candidatus Methylomirabilota bacterium]|nr:peptide deformylase [candidate division NC10 bacterium]PWB47097.1 MAG: peptide deformylase [candidate division NC10 bacterium]
MAILKVARLGHPVLRQVASAVRPETIREAETQRLIDDMIETMREYEGVGIAAPQVHVSRQIAVIEATDNRRYPDAPEIPLTVLINLEVVPIAPDLEDDWEGCLSVIDLRGQTPRYQQVRAKALDREGRLLDFVATGFHARVLQHERDHLLGKLFIDRMKSLETFSYLSEYGRYWKH